MSNDFLSRWSRRKREAESASAPDIAPTPATAATAPSPLEPWPEDPQAPVVLRSGDDDGVAATETTTIPGDITPEELAALPTPDEMTATSDITGFLRQGVPAALRNRALRRMWSIDPSIRDSIGDARDYAWDWNTPGGVPASGPLSSTMDVKKMLRDIFGSDKEEGEETRLAASEGDPILDETGSVEALADDRPRPEASPAAIGPDRRPAAPVTVTEQEPEPEEDSAASRPLPDRRHGGALPS